MRRLATLVVLAAGCAFAHHSLHGMYIWDGRTTIHGTVVSFLFRNPHTVLGVEATDQNGNMQEWSIEWGPAGALGSTGIKRDTLRSGDEVTIIMSPAKDPASHWGLLRIIRRASDGFEWGTRPGEAVPEWRMNIK